MKENAGSIIECEDLGDTFTLGQEIIDDLQEFLFVISTDNLEHCDQGVATSRHPWNGDPYAQWGSVEDYNLWLGWFMGRIALNVGSFNDTQLAAIYNAMCELVENQD